MGEAKHRKAITGGVFLDRRPGSEPSCWTAVGRGDPAPAPFLRALPSDGGAAMVLGGGRFEIITGMPRLDKHDVQALRSGPIKLGVARHGDALVFAFEAPGYATLDMPYDHRRVPADQRGLPVRTDGRQGILALIYAIDTESRRVAAARGVSITPAFCGVIDRHLRDLDTRVDQSNWNFERDLHAFQRMVSIPDLFRACEVVEIAGTPFPTERWPVQPSLA